MKTSVILSRTIFLPLNHPKDGVYTRYFLGTKYKQTEKVKPNHLEKITRAIVGYADWASVTELSIMVTYSNLRK